MPEITAPKNVPSMKYEVLSIKRFRGVDLTSGIVNVDASRSPEAPNMMPDDDGYPKKRPGFATIETYGGAIYGAYSLTVGGRVVNLIHAGTRLYADGTQIYAGMNAAWSTAAQHKERLWILDGKTYLYVELNAGGTPVCATVASIATVPTVSIGRAPDGKSGATSYHAVNLLTGWRKDSFLAKSTDKVFVLSFNGLSAAAVKVTRLNTAGAWETYTGASTVDRAAGKVTFTDSPALATPEGEDNVRIEYETATNKAATVNKCRLMILYGVKGEMDRVFLAGNPDEPNVDHWSEFDDPAYIGDTYYSLLGQAGSPIMGYSVQNDKLVTHKRGEENNSNVFVRYGELDDEGFGVFPKVNVLQGEGAVSTRAFASVSGEPMFLSALGVQAMTPNDVTGERYVQRRSYFIDAQLKQAADLSKACAVVFGRFYVLAVGDRLYLLDSEQKEYVSKQPYSTYQYECYYWTGINASAVFVRGGALCFGTEGGKVCRFTGGKTEEVYSDDGVAIPAAWTTPLLNLDRWSRKKTVTGAWVVAQPYGRSGGTIYYATDKDYEKPVREFNVDIFSFEDIDFSRFTFNCMDRPSVVATGKKAKKIKLFALKVENVRLDEPFGLQAIEIEYRTGGKVKR